MIWQNRNFFCKVLLTLAETLSVALLLSNIVDHSLSIHVWNTIAAGGIVFLISKKTNLRARFNLTTFLIIWFLFFLFQSISWGIKTFPLDDPQLVILTLQMPLDGFTSIFIKDFALKVLIPCLFTSFFFSLLIEPWMVSFGEKKIMLFIAITFAALFITQMIYYNIPVNMYRKCLSDDNLILHNSSFFQDNYISIDTVAVQKKSGDTKNLILIIMESIENSFADSASGGIQQKNLIQELMPADSNECHFSSNGFLGGGFNTVGTDLTISATIAKTTGLPVLLKRTYNDTLLKNIPSIYNILQKFGYSNVFIQGTDANFSGTKNYILSHGVHTLYDMHSLKQQQDINELYRNFRSFEIGITDRTILDISKHILDSLSKNKHFSLTIATIETHFRYGFYNKACDDKPINSTEQATLEATIRCASKDMRNFVNWIKQQSFYPNTEIIIVGDHLFMGNYLVNNAKNRRWHNLYINPATKPQTLNREFTSFDIAPTILESLGFTISSHKMGFGVSLFSSESTIVEKIGIDSLNHELTNMKKSIEYNEIFGRVNMNRINSELSTSKN